MTAGKAQVVMYATQWCGYCARARRLLAEKGVAYTEIDVEAVDGAREEMRARSGRTSVPQIFIGDQHLGGYDDTKALHDSGELDRLLAAATNA